MTSVDDILRRAGLQPGLQSSDAEDQALPITTVSLLGGSLAGISYLLWRYRFALSAIDYFGSFYRLQATLRLCVSTPNRNMATNASPPGQVYVVEMRYDSDYFAAMNGSERLEPIQVHTYGFRQPSVPTSHRSGTSLDPFADYQPDNTIRDFRNLEID